MHFKQHHKSFCSIFLIVLNTSLGSFFFGYNIGVFNSTQECIEIINNWGNEKTIYDGLVTAFMPLGAIIGSIIGGILSTKIGRKKTCITADLMGIVGCVIWIFKGTSLILIGRFVCGVVVGINSVIVPVYINEISPPSISGVMGAITDFMINFGVFISFLISLNIPDAATIRADPENQYWWRFVFGFPIITCIFRSLVLLFIYRFDTPLFLISNGKDEETKFIIKKLYHEEFVEQIYKEYKAKIDKCQEVSFKELLGTQYRRRLLTGILLGMFQHFSGATAVLFYSDKILEGDQNGKSFTVLIGLMVMAASALSGMNIDKFGRKSILLLGEVICIIILLLLIIFGYLNMRNASKYVILAFEFNFGFSLGPILWLYLPEILPGKGVSVSALANWFAAGLVGFCFPIANEAIQIPGTFLIFLGIMILALIYTFFWVKETKDKNREKIKQREEKEIIPLTTEERIITVQGEDVEKKSISFKSEEKIVDNSLKIINNIC